MIPPTIRLMISPAWSKASTRAARSWVIAPICWTSPVSDVRSSAFVARLSDSPPVMPWNVRSRALKSLNLAAAPASGCCPRMLKPRLLDSSSETPARSWITAPDSSMSALVVFSVAAA